MSRYVRLLLAATTFCSLLSASTAALALDAWFKEFKTTADDRTLHKFLHALPKGGDLHIHLSGSVHPEWLLQLALDAEADGWRYYTKVRLNECRYGTNEYGGNSYLLLFRTITELQWDKLDACEQNEYIPLKDMDERQRQAWLNALRLDKDYEGRAEFFEAHWPRLGGILRNPHIMADTIVMNMQHFGAEGVRYIEGQAPFHGLTTPEGKLLTPAQVLKIYEDRIAEADAQATGVTIRFQTAVLRFLPMAEDMVRFAYRFVAENPMMVSVNMVGREDNDKGYPLRFLEVFREMRRQLPDVRLSIHGGEVDEPNQHVRDTLLLGAERIGHGVNLITDPDTLLLMRHNAFLVEVNLVSNLLLEYVEDYSTHPFPEYLRTGVPVALSTDDRGMWDSTMTDEFFVAVKEFNLSWAEIKRLLRNSIAYGFMEEDVKARLLEELEKDLQSFERRVARSPEKVIDAAEPQYRGFLCRQYQVCAEE